MPRGADAAGCCQNHPVVYAGIAKKRPPCTVFLLEIVHGGLTLTFPAYIATHFWQQSAQPPYSSTYSSATAARGLLAPSSRTDRTLSS